MQHKVAFIDSVHPVLWERLSNMGFLCVDLTKKTGEEIVDELPVFFGAVIRSKFKFTDELLKKCVQLKFIARSGSGMENIDLITSDKLGIKCFNSPEGNKTAVAEHTLGMLLMLFNKLNFADTEVRNGEWNREANRGIELSGKTIGIIGCGTMGNELAKKLNGFGCEVLGFDKFKSGFSSEYLKEVPWETFCNESDVVSLNVNYLPENENMCDEAFFNSFKKPIYFVNTARGKCVVTKDLIKGINDSKVLGACLDVLEFESIDFENELNHPAFNALKNNSKVVLSPHVAGWTNESYFKLSNVLADKIESFIKSNKPS